MNKFLTILIIIIFSITFSESSFSKSKKGTQIKNASFEKLWEAGKVYNKYGQQDMAFKCFKEIEKRFNKKIEYNYEFYYEYGIAALKLKKIRKALNVLSRFEKLYTKVKNHDKWKLFNIRFKVAEIFFHKKDYQKSLSLLYKARNLEIKFKDPKEDKDKIIKYKKLKYLMNAMIIKCEKEVFARIKSMERIQKGVYNKY